MITTDLLVEIAAMHYESGLTQEEIAHRIGVSRPYVSRLLKRAHDEGVVEIIVHRPVETHKTLQQGLVQRFGLLDARVLATPTDASHLDISMGNLGASYLNAIIKDSMTIGVSFGNSVYHVVRALPQRRDLNSMKVTQLVGGRHGLSSETDGPMVAELLANRLGAPFYRLHAPLLVDTPEMRDSLMVSPAMADALSAARSSDVALVGIGAWSNFAPSLQRLNYHLNEESLRELQEAGVVGDVLTRCVDASGNVIASEINDRIVGIDPAELRSMRWVIGLAWHEDKAPAILAALRGRYLNVLITCESCARQVLDAST
jgi:DNA-binding transcriptional regulator LsrR (DeoR family)